jgi:hypothetical protein
MQYVSEILNDVAKASNDDEKLRILRSAKSYELLPILKNIVDPNVKWHFNKIPPFNRMNAPPELGYIHMGEALRRSYLFNVDNPKAPAGLTMSKRTELLTQILEALSGGEADIYCNMILKKLPRGLPKKVAKEFTQL